MTAALINLKEIKKIRHKAEKPLFILCVINTIIIMLIAIDNPHIISEFIADEWVTVIDELFPDEGSGELGSEELDSDESGELNWILIILAFYTIVVYLYYAAIRAYAIRVSERNFPEIYHKSVEYANRLGMKKVPVVYIQQDNGLLNAFASAVIGKPYIMLNAELVDVAYMEHKDFDTVFFVLAHEFGHHYFKHTSFLYRLATFFGIYVPFFGKLLSRSQEYSCDRVAQLLLERSCVSEAMILSAGRHLYKYVDTEDYLANAKNEKGFFLWLINLLATHPIMTKRIAALADHEKRSGKLL